VPEIEVATTSLVSFWNGNLGDNFTAATPAGEQSAINGEYRTVRIEGAILKERLPGTVPLELYWSADRADNFSTATTAGKDSALAAGYRLVRVQGYVYPTKTEGTIPLKLFWSPGREDNFTTATPEGERDANAAEYRFARIEGYVIPASASRKGSKVRFKGPSVGGKKEKTYIAVDVKVIEPKTGEIVDARSGKGDGG
jgi:hypothetical protein